MWLIRSHNSLIQATQRNNGIPETVARMGPKTADRAAKIWAIAPEGFLSNLN